MCYEFEVWRHYLTIRGHRSAFSGFTARLKNDDAGARSFQKHFVSIYPWRKHAVLTITSEIQDYDGHYFNLVCRAEDRWRHK